MASNEKVDSTDRRQQILEAALKVFSTKGFQKATNKDIAEAAGGISPGLIYWYFKDKEDLFLSLFRERAAILQLADNPERLMDLPPREGLTLIGQAYLRTLTAPANVAMFRILISEVIRFPQLGEMLQKIVVGRIFATVTAYLQYQIEQERLRPHDTAIATRSFIGMFIAHVLSKEVLRQPTAIATSDEQVCAMAVDIFLHGLEMKVS